MSYIYHLKPEPFEGNSLIPLNLMDKESELYKGHAKKYIGRESLMEEVIPTLNCKWNDVVQFSALDPQVIVDELKKINTDLKAIRPYYFKIHIRDIISKYDAVIFDRKKREKGDFTIQEHEVSLLNEENYKELFDVPTETIHFWNDVKRNGGKYLWFPFITHILVKGIIDTTDFDICELKI